jgi:hypothetical protein
MSPSWLNFLGLGGFAVVGGSAGSPHALAVSAIVGDRVSRVACYLTVAPRAELGVEEWSRGQVNDIRDYLAAVEAPDDEALRYFLALDEVDRAAASSDDPDDAYGFEQNRLGDCTSPALTGRLVSVSPGPAHVSPTAGRRCPR